MAYNACVVFVVLFSFSDYISSFSLSCKKLAPTLTMHLVLNQVYK